MRRTVPRSRLVAHTAPPWIFRPLAPRNPVEASSGAVDQAVAVPPVTGMLQMVPRTESVA